MLHDAGHVFNIFLVSVPDFSGPLYHLGLHVLSRVDGCQTSSEAGPATSSNERVADRVGVYNRGFHVFVGYAQCLSGLLSYGCPGAADVHRTHDQTYNAVVVDGHRHAGLEPSVGPVSRGYSSTFTISQLGLVVVMVSGSLEAFHKPDLASDQTFDTASAFFGRIQ